MMIELRPFSGHISTAIKNAVEIQTQFPQHIFNLTFNSRTLRVTDEETMHKEYFRE